MTHGAVGAQVMALHSLPSPRACMLCRHSELHAVDGCASHTVQSAWLVAPLACSTPLMAMHHLPPPHPVRASVVLCACGAVTLRFMRSRAAHSAPCSQLGTWCRGAQCTRCFTPLSTLPACLIHATCMWRGRSQLHVFEDCASHTVAASRDHHAIGALGALRACGAAAPSFMHSRAVRLTWCSQLDLWRRRRARCT